MLEFYQVSSMKSFSASLSQYRILWQIIYHLIPYFLSQTKHIGKIDHSINLRGKSKFCRTNRRRFLLSRKQNIILRFTLTIMLQNLKKDHIKT